MSQQFNIRLPKLAQEQIEHLSKVYGLTKTQVIILAVDRLTRALADESQEAKRDLRMLKTVARVVPDFDLGQDD